MPRKIEYLKHEALEICNDKNGHYMERFFRPYKEFYPKIEYCDYWRSYCKSCNMMVDIRKVEISGDAYRCKCPDRISLLMEK